MLSCRDIRSQFPISVFLFGGRSFEVLPVMNECFSSTMFTLSAKYMHRKAKVESVLSEISSGVAETPGLTTQSGMWLMTSLVREANMDVKDTRCQ